MSTLLITRSEQINVHFPQQTSMPFTLPSNSRTMASHAGPGSASDQHQWHESVLSTRSLSYVSNADMETSLRSGTGTSTSHSGPPVRKSTLTSIADAEDDDDNDNDIYDEPAMDLSSSTEDLPSSSQPQTRPTSTRPTLPITVSSSALFRLPRELRELIYTHLLSAPLGLGFSFPTDRQTRDVHPAILATCRAVHAETAAVLYSRNRLIFSHPSDANMFRHALASEQHAASMSALILRVKNTDSRLWTAYFNSTCAKRSLVRDYPELRSLVVRFRGPRFNPVASHEQNAAHWLRDQKLHELIVSVRKCVRDTKIELCVRVPSDWRMEAWDAACARAAEVWDAAEARAAVGVHVEAGAETRGERGGEGGVSLTVNPELLSVEPLMTRRDGSMFLFGVWLGLETEGT